MLKRSVLVGNISPEHKQDPHPVKIGYAKNVVIVEGESDAQLILKLINKNITEFPDIEGNITIDVAGSYEKLKDKLDIYPFAPDFTQNMVEKVLVVADTNTMGIVRRFNEIKSIISTYPKTYIPPHALGKLGLVTTNKKRVAVYLLPNNHDSGNLETLCLKAVSDQRKLREIDNFIDSLSRLGLIQFDRTNISIEDKARLQMYLATLPSPGGHVVRGLENNAFNLSSQEFTPLLNFLELVN